MSSERVEVVRELIDEWNRGEVDGLLARATEDFEWHPKLVESVEGGAFRGHDGMREFLRDWASTWEKWDLEAEELRDLGDQVLALTRVHAKGRGSGLEFDQPIAQLFEFRGNRVCRGETFLDQDEAAATAERRRARA
jgi:ketosteroid isomerase-like protein